MKRTDPTRRLSAEEALQQWRTIRGNMSYVRSHWRLRHPGETLSYGFALDIAFVLRSIVRFVRFIGRGFSSSQLPMHTDT